MRLLQWRLLSTLAGVTGGCLAVGCQVTPSAGATEAQTVVPRAPEPPASPPAAEVEPSPLAPAKVHEPCAKEMALVGDVCVDRYEAHLVVQTSDGSLVRHPEHERPGERIRYEARSEKGVRPQSYISSLEAARACDNAGKRLCSLEEWRRACRGPDETTYPYGGEFERKKCNIGRKHILAELHGTDPLGWNYDHFNDPELIKQGDLAAAGRFAECRNAYGTHDMVGNLHEWVSDRVDTSLPLKTPLTPEIRRTVRRKRGNGVFVGGFFSTTNQHGRGCDFITIAHEPKYHDYSTGFRCCRDAEK